MDLTIHTYGYFDSLYYVLNALAMFRNSEFFMIIVKTSSVLVGCYYAVHIAYSGSYSHLRAYLMKVVGMLVLVNSLLLPTAEMVLKDHVTKKIGKVDNIPLAFALPVGLLEEFGHLLTIGFEQVFAPIESAVNPNDPVFSYYNYGMLFGARLKKEVSQTRIKDPEFVENMRCFIKQCVVLPAMIGYQFTPEQLITTKDMWGLVSKNAGTLTRLDMRIGTNRTSMTCKGAISYFEKSFAQENSRILAKFKNTVFSFARSSQNYDVPQNTVLNKVFESNVKTLYGGAQPAGDVLRQQMMINSLSDYTNGNYYLCSELAVHSILLTIRRCQSLSFAGGL